MTQEARLHRAFAAGVVAVIAHARAGAGAGDLNIPGLRFWPLKRFPYLVFYVEREDQLDVLLVLHEKRDIPSELADQVKAGAEKVITKNGESYVALIDADRLDYYHRLERERIHLLLIEHARRGFEDIAAGRTQGADAAIAYDQLPVDLRSTVIPNLARFPRMGRRFFVLIAARARPTGAAG